MATLHFHPTYQDQLQSLGLTTAEAFLQLPGVVQGGHPDRHVVSVQLADGTVCYLKREHRVPVRERLLNAWQGFGLVSKSLREYELLRQLRMQNLPCPEPMAAGEHDGRAFVLIRGLTSATELRIYLQRTSPHQRRQLVVALARTLARVHQSGFDHRDLYSKHVLVTADAEGLAIHLLDWQRARRRPWLSWPQRWQQLAALHATLAEELLSVRERLRCLRAYLRACGRVDRDLRRQAIAAISACAERLLERRRVRELRLPPLEPGQQNLIWIEGEALCVTRAFHAEMQGQVPWGPAELYNPLATAGKRRDWPLPDGRQACLSQRAEWVPCRGLWYWLRSQLPASPELLQAAILFRLQRYGIATPRLLAVGQRQPNPWRLESFVLVEPLPGTVPLLEWLRRPHIPEVRQPVLEQTAALLRALHNAQCGLEQLQALEVHDSPLGWQVVLGSVAGVRMYGRWPRVPRWRELQRMVQALLPMCRQRECVAFAQAYLQVPELGVKDKQRLRQLWRLGRTA